MMRLLFIALLLLPIRSFSATEWPLVGIEIESSGWVAKVKANTCPNFNGANANTNLMVTNGFSSLNLPGNGNAITFYLTSMGYDSSGNPTTVGRTIYGTKVLRLPYPLFNTNSIIAEQTTNCVLRIALSDFIYSRDSNITATAIVGFFYSTNGASVTNSAAFTSATVTNSSTLPYPKVIANWTEVPHRRSGNELRLSATGFHASGRDGKPLAGMRFQSKDAHGNSVSQFVAQASIDRNQLDSVPVIEYFCNQDYSSFTNGDVITNYFQAYPIIGDSSAVCDASDGVNPVESPYYRPLWTFCDRLNRFTGVAIVSITNNAGSAGVVTTNGTDGAAFASISQAAKALADTNNAMYGINSAFGTIRLRAGGHSFVGTAASPPTTRPDTWLIITNMDGRDLCVITNGTGNGDIQDRIALHGVSILANEAFTFSSCSNLWLHQCVLAVTNSSQDVIDGIGFHFVTQCISSNWDQGFTQQGSQNTTFALVRGNWIRGKLPVIHPYTVVGNDMRVTNVLAGLLSTSLSGIPYPAQNEIIAFNKFMGLDYAGSTITSFYGGSQNLTNGAAIIQNILENIRTNSPGTLDFLQADSTTGFGTNVIYWHNTINGERFSYGYDAINTIAHPRYQWSIYNNIWSDANTKHDTFTGDTDGAQGARIGGWPVLYGVSHVGNFNVEATNTEAGGSFILEFAGLGCYQPAITPGTQPLVCGQNQASFAAYVSDQSITNKLFGVNASGSGDYRFRSESPVWRTVGKWVLPYDIEGHTRSAVDPPGAYISGNLKQAPIGF